MAPRYPSLRPRWRQRQDGAQQEPRLQQRGPRGEHQASGRSGQVVCRQWSRLSVQFRLSFCRGKKVTILLPLELRVTHGPTIFYTG